MTLLSLSPEQQRVVESWGKGMAVLAGAGSGKTTTLVLKCIRLVEFNEKARFAAVSFTEKSASDLRVKLSSAFAKKGNSSALASHWVMTIHGLCGSIIQEYPRQAGFDGEETVLSEPEARMLWKSALESLWLDDLPEETCWAFEQLMDREQRSGLYALLDRVRDLFSLGILNFLKDSEDPSSKALAQVASFVIEKYTRMKQRRGVLDFHDLEQGADRALNFEDVRGVFHRRFDLLLVDEFQDTNPIQARIIEKIARPDASNLCVVGDPKQSIYRFRDADVSVFEEFCKKLPLQYSLSWNFRSVPGVINFVNEICEKTFEASGLRFDALVPQRSAIGEESPVVQFNFKDPSELGVWIKSQVQMGVPLHSMALLVRRIRGNEKWFKALISEGIPLAMGSGGLFWEDARVRELVAFLKWWDHPGNSMSGGIFLRAPWMKISDTDLDQWILSDPTWAQPFLSSLHPVAARLNPLWGQIIRPGELLIALLDDPEIEQELGSQLLGLWHRVEEFSSQGLDFHSIVLELASSLQEGRREKEVPAPRNLGQLTVLTLHGSKGLEFPVVILIDFPTKPKSSDAPLLFWDRNQGSFLGKRDSKGERDRIHPLEILWREGEKKKELAESKRLFYVALTRAQDRLVLVCIQNNDEDFEFDSTSAPLQDYWRAWIELGSSREVVSVPLLRSAVAESLKLELSDEIKIAREVKKAPFESWMRARHSVTEWALLSHCPRAYEWTFIRPVVVIEGPDAVESTTLDLNMNLDLNLNLDLIPEAVHESPPLNSERVNQVSHEALGSRVHACLEREDFAGLKKLEEEVGSSRFLAEPLIQWATQSPLMAPADPEKGRWVWNELPFEVPLGEFKPQEVLVGSIDRLVLQKENGYSRYLIIDFKVSEQARSVKRLLEAYQVQIELYATALEILNSQRGKLEIEAVIVNISSAIVQRVTVPLGRLNLKSLMNLSLTIIKGTPGEPKPGTMCRYCEFQKQCPEGQSYCLNNLINLN